MNFKKIATITMAALLAISSSMPASAVTKNWRVYHAQGAPTTSGIFDSGQLMPKGGSVCEVKMTGYENLSKTTLYAYRQGHKAVSYTHLWQADSHTSSLNAEVTTIPAQLSHF